MNFFEILTYYTVSFLTFLTVFIPFSVIQKLGEWVGLAAYYLVPTYRKRTLSNLSLARTLHINNIHKMAKDSFRNLGMTVLEFAKIAYMRDLSKVVHCKNPEIVNALLQKGQGVIFFCGHQANWELLFLDGSQRMEGMAIGRPMKNRGLYQWILKKRERFGGTVFAPKQTMEKGISYLRQGKFVGIVGDQALPESSYAFDFLGRRAWTTPAPAILAYRTGAPIVVAKIMRKKGKHIIEYSEPIWPNRANRLHSEVPRLMKTALQILENAILKAPAQWLWQHNRWKQETPRITYYKYRFDTVLIICSKDINPDSLKVFREIYPRAFLTFLVPLGFKVDVSDSDVLFYNSENDLFIHDLRFKIVYNFSGNHHLSHHFKKQSAFIVVDQDHLENGFGKKYFSSSDNFAMRLRKGITRPNTTWVLNAAR